MFDTIIVLCWWKLFFTTFSRGVRLQYPCSMWFIITRLADFSIAHKAVAHHRSNQLFITTLLTKVLRFHGLNVILVLMGKVLITYNKLILLLIIFSTRVNYLLNHISIGIFANIFKHSCDLTLNLFIDRSFFTHVLLIRIFLFFRWWNLALGTNFTFLKKVIQLSIRFNFF